MGRGSGGGSRGGRSGGGDVFNITNEHRQALSDWQKGQEYYNYIRSKDIGESDDFMN